MSRVREFQRADVPAVADLWLKVFQRREVPSPPSLRSYFSEIFLDHPWCDDGLNSLVYEEKDGDIVGFLGVLPRRMVFEKQCVQVAVSSQFMVDTAKHHGNAAIQLMRTFLEGPQDLSMTDGATEGARRIWVAAHGEPAILYGCTWDRVLRPGGYVLEKVRKKTPFRLVATLARPVAAVSDSALARTPFNPYIARASHAAGIDASVECLLTSIAALPARYVLRPHYDLASLRWVLDKAADAKTRGQFRRIVVRDTQGAVLGWYVYYAKPGGTSKVLQIGGRDHTITEVIRHLFHDAWASGSVSVSGRLEPAYARELTSNRCSFSFPNVSVLVHSRNQAILNVIHSGRAFLSRLDGEWWLRFHEEQWI